MSPSGTITGVSTTLDKFTIVVLYQPQYDICLTSTIGAFGLTGATELSS